ncbi:extracellular solute-binding protein [Streptomyces sp. NPDC050625]|uniref:ABC transporter substrate-binding protein n=1 Tax=Streptomyces sp. NPDC050625 TaxID=3154629 RepID=UPI0034140F26
MIKVIRSTEAPAGASDEGACTMRIPMTARTAVASIATAALVMTTAACGGDSEADKIDASKRPTDAAMAKLYDAAVKEIKADGKLHVYTGMQDAISAKLGEDYTARFGLPIKTENIAGTSLTERYVNESKSGKIVGDVLMLGSCSFIEQQIKDGLIESFDGLGLPQFPAADWPKSFVWADSIPVLQQNLWGFGYNTTEVKEADMPKSWEHLLDPKWKGKLLLIGPETSTGMAGAWDWLLRTKGEGYVKKLAAQAGLWGAGTQSAAQQLAAGEQPIMVPTAETVTTTVAKAGGPTDFIALDETTGAPMCGGVTEGTSHPAQAKLFLANLLTKDGNNEFSAIPGNGTVGPFGGSLKFPAKFTQSATLSPARIEEVIKAVKG